MFQEEKTRSPVKYETGVPIPAINRELYRWKNMNVGNSLFFENANANSIHVVAWKAGKRHGYKFTVRKIDGGVRVWRTA